MYPFVVIALGIAVLLFGRRLAILGAAIGGLLGVVLLPLFDNPTLTTQLLVVLGLALAGFFAAAFARGVIEVVILVLGALAGAAIVQGLLSLFSVDEGLLNWLLAVIGGVIGLMVIRRSRRGSRDWGMIVLADLVGALLIVRGLGLWFPGLRDTIWTTLILLALLVVGFVFQGGYLDRRKAAAPPAKTPPAKAPATTAPAVKTPVTTAPPVAAPPTVAPATTPPATTPPATTPPPAEAPPSTNATPPPAEPGDKAL